MKKILLSLIAVCAISAAHAQMRLSAEAFVPAYALKFPSTETSIAQVNATQASSPMPHTNSAFGTQGVVSSTTGIVVQEELVAGKLGQWISNQRIERFMESRKKHAAIGHSGGGNK